MKRIVVLATVGICIYACSKAYLDKRPLGQLDEPGIANKRGVENLLIGAYSVLDGVTGGVTDWFSAGSNWIFGSINGTEAYTGSDEYDDARKSILPVEKFATLIPTNEAVATKWRVLYDGVQRSNDVLRILAKASDILPAEQNRIAAEARFLRAFYHFEAKKIWGKVPFIDESITYENGNYRVSNERDIWPDIENDLKFGIDNLEPTPYQGAVGRANKYTAMALLAKAYMFQEKYADAKAILEIIINSGKYKLAEHYHDNFDPALKNRSESVFSAQSSVNDGSNGYNGNYGDVLNFPHGSLYGAQPGACCGFFSPSQYLVDHFKTIDGLPDFMNFNTPDIKNDEGIPSDMSFTPYDGPLDPRLDWTVGRRGIPYLDWGIHPGKIWTRTPELNGPYNPKKNSYDKSQESDLTEGGNFWTHGATANNINLIRYADVLLWAAEAEVEAGSLEIARGYVNDIRRRAKDPTGWVKKADGSPAANYEINEYAGPWTDPIFARTAIRFERMLELGMEGHRFFDLVRWHIADTEINDYFGKEKETRSYLRDAVFTKGRNEYLPIPQTQIDLSVGVDGVPMLKQNPGY